MCTPMVILTGRDSWFIQCSLPSRCIDFFEEATVEQPMCPFIHIIYYHCRCVKQLINITQWYATVKDKVCIMHCGTSFNAPLWCASFLVPLGIGHTERGCIGAYAMVASELTNPALVRPWFSQSSLLWLSLQLCAHFMPRLRMFIQIPVYFIR